MLLRVDNALFSSQTGDDALNDRTDQLIIINRDYKRDTTDTKDVWLFCVSLNLWLVLLINYEALHHHV